MLEKAMRKPFHLFTCHRRDEDDFTVIAHRGASAYYPENTFPSFEGAIAMGADMVELDVQLTSDAEVVVFHDENLSRCTNGRGRITDYTLMALKKLDAGGWFGRKFKNVKIPTLDEVLDICKNRIAVNVEIKTASVSRIISGGIEEKCLKIVERCRMKEHVVFSSFDPCALLHLKRLDKTAPVAVLYKKKIYGSKRLPDMMDALDAVAFNCSKSELNNEWMALAQSCGIPINVYTVNDIRSMRKLINMGVSGIFTNKPDVLKKVSAEIRKLKSEDKQL
jgi:glycerophosphoryl diester phosphodiesterase